MPKKKLKAPTKRELTRLFHKVEAEGFGYYMLDYGPDLNLIERMGYNREELEKALQLLNKLRDHVLSIEPLEETE